MSSNTAVMLASTLPAPHALSSELRLLLAVLEQGIDDYTSGRKRNKQHHHDANEWLLSDEADHPCSFEVICDALKLDASAVRAKVLAATGRIRKRTMGRRHHQLTSGKA